MRIGRASTEGVLALFSSLRGPVRRFENVVMRSTMTTSVVVDEHCARLRREAVSERSHRPGGQLLQRMPHTLCVVTNLEDASEAWMERKP